MKSNEIYLCRKERQNLCDDCIEPLGNFRLNSSKKKIDKKNRRKYLRVDRKKKEERASQTRKRDAQRCALIYNT